MGRLNEMWERAESKAQESVRATKPVKATSEHKRILATRDLPFQIVSLERKERGGSRNIWHVKIEVYPQFFDAHGQGLPGRFFDIEQIDSPERNQVFSELANMLPYGPAVLQEERPGVPFTGYKIVDAPPRTRGEQNLAQKSGRE